MNKKLIAGLAALVAVAFGASYFTASGGFKRLFQPQPAQASYSATAGQGTKDQPIQQSQNLPQDRWLYLENGWQPELTNLSQIQAATVGWVLNFEKPVMPSGMVGLPAIRVPYPVGKPDFGANGPAAVAQVYLGGSVENPVCMTEDCALVVVFGGRNDVFHHGGVGKQQGILLAWVYALDDGTGKPGYAWLPIATRYWASGTGVANQFGYLAAFRPNPDYRQAVGFAQVWEMVGMSPTAVNGFLLRLGQTVPDIRNQAGNIRSVSFDGKYSTAFQWEPVRDANLIPTGMYASTVIATWKGERGNARAEVTLTALILTDGWLVQINATSIRPVAAE